MSNEYEVGSAKTDITSLCRGSAMLGYGKFHHRAFGVETPLHARAFVFRSVKTGKKIAWVLADIAFITSLLRQLVVERILEKFSELNLGDQNIMLTANHTHCAPGGYSRHLIYNLPNEGVLPEVVESYANGIIEAIVEADGNLKPSSLLFHKKSFEIDVPVAFNRSHGAYNQNPEVVKKISKRTRHLGVDRNMYLLRVDGSDGIPQGMINWFGLHCTSIKSSHEVISSDHKGMASDSTEESFTEKSPHYIAAFAQAAAGDVSPNYMRHSLFGEDTGPSRDNFKNRDRIARYQKEHALRLNQEALDSPDALKFDGEIDYLTHHVYMPNVRVNEKFSNGDGNARVGRPVIGTGVMMGTAEGRGAFRGLILVLNLFAYIFGKFDRAVHGAKYFMVEGLERRFGGIREIRKSWVPGFVDPIFGWLKRLDMTPTMKKEAYLPANIPLQIFILGPLAIVAIPGEPTTIAAKRLKSGLLNSLKERGVKEVVIQGYSNTYSGYLTTPEEYRLQEYEGAHSMFGRWTLPAYQQLLESLAEDLLKVPSMRSHALEKPPERFNIEAYYQELGYQANWKARLSARFSEKPKRSNFLNPEARRPEIGEPKAWTF